jgi:hypothetical protein
MPGVQDSFQQFVGGGIQIVGFIEQQGRVSGVDTVIDRSGRNGVGSLAPGRQLLGEIESRCHRGSWQGGTILSRQGATAAAHA